MHNLDYISLNNPSFNNYQRLNDIGRIALIKLRSEKDALRLYLEKIKLNIPLVHNKKGNPNIALTNYLRRFIEENS